jgi:GDPmannose 4,6-dehydratase
MEGVKKKALITGVTGQDGSYLAELLLSKGYEVHGIVRRSSVMNRGRIDHLLKDEEGTGYTGSEKGNLILHYGDLTDSTSIEKIIKIVMPDEIYNLGAQSHVRVSFDIPENTANIVALGALRLIEAVKNACPHARVYQASSSEMYGEVLETPQNEKTPFNPMSPYACSKLFAFNILTNYRTAYNLHLSNGILFNHESERRGESFVTRKITKSLARIKLGLQKELFMGNLDSKRDWGHAKDYVKAMWLILQKDIPGDYVIGTGETHTVREFLEESIKVLGLKLKSNGKSGIEEEYLDENNNPVIKIDKKYFRPSEVNLLLSDPSKAFEILGWRPEVRFHDLVKIMCEYDLKKTEEEYYLKNR